MNVKGEKNIMGTYNKIVGRSQTGEQLIPPEQVKAILQDTPKSSVVLDKAVKARMSTTKQTQPVLATLPDAYCCLLYTSPSPRDQRGSRMPSSA